MNERPCFVYRLFGENDDLLYVGISDEPSVRLFQHAMDKPWWSDVKHGTVLPCATRVEALREEARAIAMEIPRHNISGMPKPYRKERLGQRWEPFDPGPLSDEDEDAIVDVGYAAQYLSMSPTWVRARAKEGHFAIVDGELRLGDLWSYCRTIARRSVAA